MERELTWRKAVETVLQEAPDAMHYREIAAEIMGQGLRLNVGATPAATVSVVITNSIRQDGARSPFRKVGKGLYIWKAKNDTTAPGPSSSINTGGEGPEEEQYDVISSFGMFWRREEVEWTSSPKILGMQQIGAAAVDFSNQIGIYLLYDGREIIYVGRATERPLGKRLYEHTLDRLSSRWDRFSWFGILPVSDDGKLGKPGESFAFAKLIPALEAILIEALEPRQNRKRGDDLSAVEYIQQSDPEIRKRAVKQAMETALSKL